MNGVNIHGLTVGCLPVNSEQCVESFEVEDVPDTPVGPDVTSCVKAADCSSDEPVCCVYKTNGRLDGASFEGLDLGCFAVGDDLCMEEFETVDPPSPGPEPVVAPSCEKTADCDSGETCCVYTY